MRENVMKKTLREQIAEILRKKILSGEIKPGERLIEAEISEEYQVSRGPVREALRQIEEEGLITYLSHKGCIVRELTYEDMQESYLIRSALEILAVEIYEANLPKEYEDEMEEIIKEMEGASNLKDVYSIVELDERFHCCIVEASGCSKLLKMWKMLEGDNAATYLTMRNEVLMPFAVIARNHRWILEALQSHDVSETQRKIREHYMVVPQTLYEKKHSLGEK